MFQSHLPQSLENANNNLHMDSKICQDSSSWTLNSFSKFTVFHKSSLTLKIITMTNICKSALYSSRKNPYPPHARSLEIPRGRGVLETKSLEAKYEAKLEFPGRGGGGGLQTKNLLWGLEVWIFSGTASDIHYIISNGGYYNCCVLFCLEKMWFLNSLLMTRVRHFFKMTADKGRKREIWNKKTKNAQTTILTCHTW